VNASLLLLLYSVSAPVGLGAALLWTAQVNVSLLFLLYSVIALVGIGEALPSGQLR